MLTDPVRIVVGGVGEANEDITQVVEIMDTDQEKWAWLLKHLIEFTSCKPPSVSTSLPLHPPSLPPPSLGSWERVAVCDS